MKRRRALVSAARARLKVPMKLGSPGMDGADYDNRQDAYDVLLMARDGGAQTFNSYFKPKERS